MDIKGAAFRGGSIVGLSRASTSSLGPKALSILYVSFFDAAADLVQAAGDIAREAA